VWWRVLPVIMFACIMQTLDRGTLAFAAADMNADLGFNAEVYGIASGRASPQREYG
jgi:ACS family tartrate transporter-like MFS transporter